MQFVQRSLGYRVKFQDTTVLGLLKNKKTIKDLIDKHGCICLEDISFQPKELLDFTSQMYDSVLTLPKQLAFNNQDEIYKSVTRVGNVLIDGTLKDSKKQAIYWHQDGDFWGQNARHIINFLHTKQIPEKGGDTWVMDLALAAKFLKEEKPEIYSKLQQLIGELDINMVDDFHKLNEANLDIPPLTHHQLIKPFGRHGFDQVMFLSLHNLLEKQTRNRFQGFDVNYLTTTLAEEMGFYKHKWQKGDLLIWDNWQVMHRSSGDFEGRRLLYRTQGQEKQN